MRRLAILFFATLSMSVSATASAQSVPDAFLRGMHAMESSMAAMEHGLDVMFGYPARVPVYRGGRYGDAVAFYDHGAYERDARRFHDVRNAQNHRNSRGGHSVAGVQGVPNARNVQDFPHRQYAAVDHNQPYSMYSFLTAEEQRVYDVVYDAMAQVAPKVELYSSIEAEGVWNAIKAIRFDHPEMVWVTGPWENTNFYYWHEGNRVEITLDYNELSSDPVRYQREFLEKAEALLADARQKKTKLEQERYLFEYLITQNVYKDDGVARTAYAPLVAGTAVCEGFALAMHYLLRELDIPSYFVDGQHHAWLVVKLDDWYALDATTPQNFDGYRLDSPEAIENFAKDHFNVRYGDFSYTPDTTKFPNNRLFGE